MTDGFVSDGSPIESGIPIPPDCVITSSEDDFTDSKDEWLCFAHTKGRPAKFPVIIDNTQSAIALFNTGATCSCISYKTFQKIIKDKKIINNKIKVVQADGHSLDPIGMVELKVTLGKEQFKYKFIVCKNLKTPIIWGLDFVECHKIGFDWNANARHLDYSWTPGSEIK